MSAVKMIGIVLLDLFAFFMLCVGFRVLINNAKNKTLDTGLAFVSIGIIMMCLFPFMLTLCYAFNPALTKVPTVVGATLIIGLGMLGTGSAITKAKDKNQKR